MRLEPTPRPEHVLRVSARLITSSTILHYSSDELERAVNQEQIENPALEVHKEQVCPLCGTQMFRQTCPTCGNTTTQTSLQEVRDSAIPDTDLFWNTPPSASYDMDNYGFIEADNEEGFDPITNISTNETLEESLLHQLETLVTPDDIPIAEQLVGNLNERGYLEASVQEIASFLHISEERVEYVLYQLQSLEPTGIGARDLRECLQIQLAALSEQEEPPPLASTLITRYLDLLGRGHTQEIARQLHVSEQEVRAAYQFIRSKLYPYPAHIYHGENKITRAATTYIRPDVIIRKGDTGNFEVELVEEKSYQFRIHPAYVQHDVWDTKKEANDSASEFQRHIHRQADHARFFVDCVKRRWQTLRMVAELVVEYQRAFLENGVRYLRPLTRAEIASRLNLDEGTVSRATANKYALLPNGRLIPFSDFFDGSLGIKDLLRELIESENAEHRFSDEELARMLTIRGMPMARRTVTKYREEMGIGSSRER